ncbi:RNA polymerase sigma factor [Anaerotruncus sp. 80]|uniref:RNA polymerase sigma factor n=1 Tax=Anaerotruncus colihominis TaxID=169435 RepID=A0A845QJL5_9FIRM|nr:RNA polymerase sigma factor [Anaerotruncus colihominis]NCF02299.1 RNA polymerase sigma factor [Anaerotruncus sp. 80]
MTEEEIVKLYWQRNQGAIAQTEALYGEKLLHLAENILHNHQDAEECISDTYLKAWNAIPPKKPDNLFAYLAKICRFACFDRLDWNQAKKRNMTVIELSAELEACIPDGAVQRRITGQEIGALLNSFVRQLPLAKRQMFLRRYWLGQSIEEIAELMGCSQSKVKTGLHRMRKALRSYLEEEGISI